MEWRRSDLVDAMGPEATDVYVRSLTISRDQGLRLGSAIEAEHREATPTPAQQRARSAAAGADDPPLPIDIRSFERTLRSRLTGLRLSAPSVRECTAEISCALLGFAMYHRNALDEEDRDDAVALWRQVFDPASDSSLDGRRR